MNKAYSMWHMVRKRCFLLFCTILIANSIFVGSSYAVESDMRDNNLDEKLTYLKQMILYIEDHYKGEVTEQKLIEGAYKGIFEATDMHSNYFTPSEFEELMRDSSGEFVGIGVVVSMKDNKITINEVEKGAPSEKAGLQIGDVIRYIDKKAVTNTNLRAAVDSILGEMGTTVEIGVERKGHDEIMYFNIVRDKIEVNPVRYELLKDKIGYIKLTTFNGKASKNIDIALKGLTTKNMSGIILDLRNNLGGSLTEAVAIADEFVSKEPIVHIERKNEKRKTYMGTKEKLGIPVVVLVNRLSASASEIVASAIQDTKSGIIVGTRTYGKGTVQELLTTQDGGGIKLTIAEYLSSNGQKINGIGITPDVVIEQDEKELRDMQLEKAIEVLEGK
ncbi:S41 family peptidase [Lutibacter sp. B2]|nr:S41 family peptidase [Lutibacter sp. B2]